MKQALVQYLMVIMMVVGAYMIGVYKTKVEYLEKGVGAPNANTPLQAAIPTPAPTPVNEAKWEEITKIDEGTVMAGIANGPAKPAIKKEDEGQAIGILGAEDAKVTIVEFTDYQCPFCERYFTETYSQIKKDYIETGKVKYIFRDYPLSFHPNAKPAAIAARCAARTKQYFTMHDKLFQTQAEWSAKTDATETFVGYAKEMGINTSEFEACLKDTEVAKAVDADTTLGSTVGISGTPSFLINKTILVGAQPYAQFQAAIEAELAK